MKTSMVLVGVLLASGCGGARGPAPTGGGPRPIDPSGNWSMAATDAGGKSIKLAAMFSQTGAIVTANSFTAVDNAPPFSCVPFVGSMQNGLVQNVSNFTAQVTFGSFGSFTFDATLAQDGKSFTGTYSGMPPCTGLLTSGTFTGEEVPSTSGTWAGTLQPCISDGMTCNATSDPVAHMTATLSQDDATGNVTGQFTMTGMAGLTGGTVAVAQADQDILSGHFWQFTMTDASGVVMVATGTLDQANGFAGFSFIRVPGNPRFIVAMTRS